MGQPRKREEPTMDARELEGSIVALVTPFDERGQIDFPAIDRLVDFHIQNHTDGI